MLLKKILRLIVDIRVPGPDLNKIVLPQFTFFLPENDYISKEGTRLTLGCEKKNSQNL